MKKSELQNELIKALLQVNALVIENQSLKANYLLLKKQRDNVFQYLETENSIKIEFDVKEKIKERGFTEKTILNNRGLIGAAIEETAFKILGQRADYSKG